MTQSTQSDPWAAAMAHQPTATQPGYATAQTGPASQPAEQASSFADSYEAEPSALSGLLSAGAGESLPALFNQLHAPGTEVKAKILKAPKDVQATSYPRNPGDPRLPLFWNVGSDGKRKPGTEPIDVRTGKPCDKVMDTVIELQTDWTLTPEMRAASGREDYEDDGRRVWHVSGVKFPKNHKPGTPTNSMRSMLDAIDEAKRNGIRFATDDDFVGLFITVRRVQRVTPGVSTSPWTFLSRITRD